MQHIGSQLLRPPTPKLLRGLQRFIAFFAARRIDDHRIPSELAHLDDRFLRDIGLDPVAARRELPLESLMEIERWYDLRGVRSWNRPPIQSP